MNCAYFGQFEGETPAPPRTGPHVERVTARPLTVADREQVADVFFSAWWHTFREQAGKLGRERDDVRERGRKIVYETPDGWAAEDTTGDLTGFVTVHPAKNQVVHMAVQPRVMGTGTAAQLLDLAEQSLAGRGANFAYLWVWEGNRRALMFFAKQGWQWTGRDRNRPMEGPYGLMPRRELHLAKPLTALAEGAWPDVMDKIKRREL